MLELISYVMINGDRVTKFYWLSPLGKRMKEIERKYLVVGQPPIKGINSVYYMQGYLHTEGPQVRVRISSNLIHTLTIKYKTNTPGIRDEFEQVIPHEMAADLYNRCKYKIRKWRFTIPIPETTLFWEIDKYDSPHNGLMTAEVELPNIDYDLGQLPIWIGKEITGKSKYSNLTLAGYTK